MSSLKLEFVTQTLEYLRPVLHQTRTAEGTAEAVVPGGAPDMTDVLMTTGQAALRGREIGEGSASVSLGVSATALMQGESGQMETAEVYIPMSLRLEDPALRPGQSCTVRVELRRLDGHMVSPRKVMIRADAAVTIQVWEPARQTHALEAKTPEVETLTEPLPLKLLTAMEEKRYTLEDTVRLNPEGQGGKIAACRVEAAHTESRLTGTRAVWKGTLEIQVLYLTEEGALRAGSAQLPFSQYADLGDRQETDELRLHTALTGTDVELSADGGGLNVTAQLLTQAEVWSPKELQTVEDLYSLTGQAEVEWQTASYESLVDQQLLALLGRGTLSGPTGQPAAAVATPGELTVSRSGETAEFTLPVSVQVLTQEEGRMASGIVPVKLSCTTQAAPGCRFETEVVGLEAAASPGVDGIDVKVTGTLCVRTYGQMERREVVGGTVTPEEPQASRPGIIIRRTEPGECLWDIGRQYRAAVAAIQSANALAGEPEAGTLLLIPGR